MKKVYKFQVNKELVRFPVYPLGIDEVNIDTIRCPKTDSRLIDVEEVLTCLYAWFYAQEEDYCKTFEPCLNVVARYIRELPEQEEVTGEWKVYRLLNDKRDDIIRCSNCETDMTEKKMEELHITLKGSYCPFCGSYNKVIPEYKDLEEGE